MNRSRLHNEAKVAARLLADEPRPEHLGGSKNKIFLFIEND